MRDLASMFGLHGKVALVTGAATGIGREIARLFHDADWPAPCRGRRLPDQLTVLQA